MEKERKERGRGSSRESGKWRKEGKIRVPFGLLFKGFQLFLCVRSQGACEKDADTLKH